jgi:hypothetical protein
MTLVYTGQLWAQLEQARSGRISEEEREVYIDVDEQHADMWVAVAVTQTREIFIEVTQ